MFCPDPACGGARFGAFGPHPSTLRRRTSVRNMSGSSGDPVQFEAIDAYLREEVDQGRVIRVRPDQLSPADWPDVHVSPLGVVIKPNPDPAAAPKTRLIFNLSDDSGGPSVNERIPTAFASVTYPTAAGVATWLLRKAQAAAELGQPLYAAGFDVKAAFRNIPVATADLHLNVMSWRGGVFCDTRVPFGIRTGPALFSKLGAAVVHALATQGCDVCRMADDFLLAVPGHGGENCEESLLRAVALMSAWGIAVSSAKTTHACQLIVHMGIAWDLVAQSASVPLDKWHSIATQAHEVVTTWQGAAATSHTLSVALQPLRTVVGRLQWATQLRPPSKAFLQGMYGVIGSLDATTRTARPSPTAATTVCNELAWWCDLLSRDPPSMPWALLATPAFNPITPNPIPSRAVVAFCDASGFALGAVWGREWSMWPVPHCERFNAAELAGTASLASDAAHDSADRDADAGPEPVAAEVTHGPHTPRLSRAARQSSMHLELRALLLALRCWGPQWAGQCVVLHTDNQGAARACAKWHARKPDACDTVRQIALLTMQWHICLRVQWIEGTSNQEADSVSRGRLDLFRELQPQAARHASTPSADPFERLWRH